MYESTVSPFIWLTVYNAFYLRQNAHIAQIHIIRE